MKKHLILLNFFVLLSFFTINAQCTLTAKCAGGNWNAASTWSPSGCGAVTVPGNNMVIVIPTCSPSAGAIVTVNINSPTYSSMTIFVYGQLEFSNGQKINLSCNGNVYLAPSGSLTGGNPGSKIDICGATAWNGPGPTGGPISFGGTPLPIELLFFTAQKSSENVNVNWSTATETNNDYFTVQRSIDAINFEDLSQIDGAGISLVKLDYVYEDEQPHEGVSYYRLKQTDFSGNYKFSTIVAVNIKNVEVLNFYPNPTTDNSNVIINTPEDMQISFVITSSDGKIVSNVKEKLNKGVNVVNLNLASFATGQYIFSVNNSDKVLSKKEFIIK